MLGMFLGRAPRVIESGQGVVRWILGVTPKQHEILTKHTNCKGGELLSGKSSGTTKGWILFVFHQTQNLDCEDSEFNELSGD
jgi:hypothetical protein